MTSTSIARTNTAPTAVATRADLEVVDFPALVEMGNQLVKTGFLPDHIKTGPQFAAIVMTGKELGMTPMRAVRSLQMVKGKVVEDAASQLARFKAAGGRADFKTLDDTKAVLWLQHPNGDEHIETWTVEDSKRAGLTGGNHERYRKAMMRSRAITSGLKSLGWDGAVGAYDVGEIGDVDDAPQSAPPPAPKKAPPVAAVTNQAQAVDAEIVDPDEVARIKAARAAIAEQAKRLGWTKDGKVDGDVVAANVRALSGGTMPATSIGWEDALAAIKEMEPNDADVIGVGEFAARDDAPTAA